ARVPPQNNRREMIDLTSATSILLRSFFSCISLEITSKVKVKFPVECEKESVLMRTAFQATTVLLSVFFAAASTRGVAEEQSVSPDCKTPEALFAAYKKATNDRDWRTLFSLGSIEYQNGWLMAYAGGAAVSEEDPMHPGELHTYRAI